MKGIFLDNVSKCYGNKTVFKNITCDLLPGKYQLIGPNGVGKSTLLCLIAGIERPSSGRVSIARKPDFSSEKIEIPPSLTVKMIFDIYDSYGRSNSSIRSHLVNQFHFFTCLSHRYGELSEGSKKKLKIILALSGKGEWILLDEPANALDKEAISMLNNFIEDSDRPIILVDHSNQFGDILEKTIELTPTRLCIV